MSADSRKAIAIRRRLDALALEQLRFEVSRLYAENEALREALVRAEEVSDWWREDAINMQQKLCERTGSAPGITSQGALVVVKEDAK